MLGTLASLCLNTFKRTCHRSTKLIKKSSEHFSKTHSTCFERNPLLLFSTSKGFRTPQLGTETSHHGTLRIWTWHEPYSTRRGVEEESSNGSEMGNFLLSRSPSSLGMSLQTPKAYTPQFPSVKRAIEGPWNTPHPHRVCFLLHGGEKVPMHNHHFCGAWCPLPPTGMGPGSFATRGIQESSLAIILPL